MLPIAGVIVGALGLLLGGYATMQSSKVKSQLLDDQPHIDKIDDIGAQAAAASSTASQTKTQLDGAMKGVQEAFDNVGNTLGGINKTVAALEEASKKAPAAAGGRHHGAGGPVVAGPGEYVVKPGDTSTKIARANGCTRHELMAVNPGVNWTRLHAGQKLKLPAGKDAAPAATPPPS
ncbi:MAG TPA: LysM domain-containing protein [Opitutaceae bacterium]